MVEQWTENPRVAGSIPALGTSGRYADAPYAGIAHLVERHLAKVEVASSSLVARSSSEIPTTVPFPASPKTTLWWEFPRFQPRFAPLDSRLIFTGDGFTGEPLRLL